MICTFVSRAEVEGVATNPIFSRLTVAAKHTASQCVSRKLWWKLRRMKIRIVRKVQEERNSADLATESLAIFG